MRSPSRIFFGVILVICFFVASMRNSRADDTPKYNNHYGIATELYEMYIRGNKNYRNPSVLALADSMVQRAEELGDVKAKCMAMVLPVDYYNGQSHVNMDSLRSKVKSCYDFSMSTKYKDLGFFAWSKLITRYINQYDYTNASDELSKFNEAAVESDNSYAISTYYKLLALMYNKQNLPEQSLDMLKKGMEYNIAHGEERNNYSWWRQIGNQYLSMNNLDSAEYYFNKTIASPYNNGDEVAVQNLLISRLSLATAKRDTVTAKKLIAELENKNKEGTLRDYAKEEMNNAKVELALIKGEYDAAEKLASKLAPVVKHKYDAQISSARGNYRDALQHLMAYDSIYNRTVNKDVRSMVLRNDSLFRHSLAEAQRQKLELEMAAESQRREQAEKMAIQAELDAKNAVLAQQEAEATRAKAESERAKAESAAQKAVLERQKAVIAQQKAEAERQKLEAARNESEINYNLQSKQLAEHRALEAVKDRRYVVIITGTCIVILTMLVFFLFYRNRTRREYISRITKEKEAALQANEVKDLIIQNMRHEIRTPLNAIVGFSQLLSNASEYDMTAEDAAEYAQHISDNSRNLTDIINELIESSLLASGNYELNIMDVDIIYSVQGAIYNNVRRKSETVELINNLPKSEWMTKADSSRLILVFGNILSNAYAYTTHGSVTIDGRETDDSYIVSISDTGPGIKAEDAEKVFDKFEKLGSLVPGIGLGLYISRRLLNEMGGSICVDTSYKEGCRMLVKMPKI